MFPAYILACIGQSRNLSLRYAIQFQLEVKRTDQMGSTSIMLHQNLLKIQELLGTILLWMKWTIKLNLI